MAKELSVGEKVTIKKAVWGFDDFGRLKLFDIEGEVTSIKGISPNHTNVNKYEITHARGKMYTNNENGELEF